MNKESVAAEECVALGIRHTVFEAYPSRETQLGALGITRALPVREKRLVGPWCFLDRYGPLTFNQGKPMDVAPHPHIGLQTVSWLLEGEVLHHDSLGYEALLRANGVNVMTAGAGISHSEESPESHTGRLNGVQLWIALPDQHRHAAPSLQHIEKVPAVELPGGIVQVFAGNLGGAASPARHYSDIVGADLLIHPGERLNIELNSEYEHAAFVLSGDCAIDGQKLEDRTLYYLGSNRSEVSFGSRAGGRLMFIGGPPFSETILMWWNFVARTREEIAEARADWEQHHARFGEVKAYRGSRLDAPSLNLVSRPNPAS
jgi:redox-sensitive bicupin YhaK (pirin superfamily)